MATWARIAPVAACSQEMLRPARRSAMRIAHRCSENARGIKGALVLALLFVGSSAHAQLSSRLPLERTIAGLTSADARVRREAAEALALEGTHERIAAPLRIAMEHEAVPEALSAMIATLARRADESDLASLEGIWDRASVPDRRLIVAALDAMALDAVWPLLRGHLAAEGVRGRACTALTRTDARVRWLASTLDDTALRDRVVSCLASSDASETRDDALVRAGLDLEPASAREVLGALARSDRSSEAAIALATVALDRADALLQPAALAMLARHAPDRLALDRWRTWLDGNDDREASAVRALLTLAPDAAEEALDRMRERDATSARRALAVLLDRDEAADLPRIARFVEVDATRTAALDRLAQSEAGADLLAAMPATHDVRVALALAGRLDASSSVVLRALAGQIDPGSCGAGLEGAACLALSGGASLAAAALTTERDPAIVAWLALAAAETPIDPTALRALLENDATRAPSIALVPATSAQASAADRRALESSLVRATSDEGPICRAEAVRALGRLGRSIHRAVVLRALEDPSAQVRLAAALALARVGVDVQRDLRVIGRRHVEDDPRVLAALAGTTLPPSRAPLHVRVVEHDASLEASSRVTLLLADARSLRLTPIEGEIFVPGVPDAPALVELESEPSPTRH